MHAMPTTLIEPAALLPHLGDPQWAVIDCRFDLARPDWGAGAYRAGHIPSARYAHLERDLSGPRSERSGRHPLPDPATLAATFGRLGIDATVQVIAYDQGPGAFAARLWWLLRWLGHRQVAVLDGGFAAWERAALPVSSADATHPARQFRAAPDPSLLASTAEVSAAVDSGALRNGALILVDARSAERFAGENETIDPVAGHIPGARNHPFSGNHDAHGRFLAAGELRAAWQRTLHGGAAHQLIAMCGSGVTACHNLLALEVAGLPDGRLYAGSWSEWIRDPAHAVARGA
ncbi:MAG TPA: sulfurtransferase [Steroidobacteraceae bacterium]|jgi:thiosulfate/3-mercaptopyruvate sulfurtransferase|nr:sulfurtransferase [Steroidobacteraceae bacterium]